MSIKIQIFIYLLFVLSSIKLNRNLSILQQRYEGFINTPILWEGDTIYQIEQFQFTKENTISFEENISKVIRLGKLVERFVSHQIQQDESITILSENAQIHKNKITLGELDCLLLQDKKPVHVEVVYKFYLYDPAANSNTLEPWIGPNKRDSLLQKLEKLQTKQFPILFHKETRHYLQQFQLQAEKIEQKVYFKAQLFVPFLQEKTVFPFLNQNCIIGFYIFREQLKLFQNCKFFIPIKLDWLVIPKQNVPWISFDKFSEEIKISLDNKLSPLCWLKNKNGTLQKFFVVWW